MYEFDRICEKNFPNSVYDSTLEYIKINYLRGIEISLKSKPFYSLLSPQQKNLLINTIFGDYIDHFSCFFNDYLGLNFAPKNLVRKIISSLDAEMYLSKSDIIKEGYPVNKLFFI